jgi:hypothetical protein
MKQKTNRNPSAHQQQMRFYMYFFITLALTVFAVSFYLAARYLDGHHGNG